MITAAQCNEAAKLLAEREEIADSLATALAAKRVRIQYTVMRTVNVDEPTEREFSDWRTGREMRMTKEFRALLTAGIEKQIADIDAKLRALGVEPPSAEVA